jgi:hypothetical protein
MKNSQECEMWNEIVFSVLFIITLQIKVNILKIETLVWIAEVKGHI